MEEKTTQENISESRRRFLGLIPAAVATGIAATFVAASAKYFSPVVSAAKNAGDAIASGWRSLGSVASLGGDEPIEKTLTVETDGGWTKSYESASVYVLPKHNNKVISCVCPHEGCPIVWDKSEQKFQCPCHDSWFTDGGQRLSGPSDKDLTELETRIDNGELKVRM